LRLALQPTAGWNPVQIPIDVNLEEHRRVVCRPSCVSRFRATESQLNEIELVDKHIHRSNGIVLSNPIFQPLWK